MSTERLTIFIQQVTRELLCHTNTTYAALIYSLRFFAKNTFHDYDYITLGTSAILLATKTQENLRPLCMIMEIVRNIKHLPLDITDFRHQVLNHEEYILLTLGLEFDVDPIHNYRIAITEYMMKHKYISRETIKEFRSLFLSHLNDIQLDSIILGTNSKTIAMGCAYFAISSLTKKPIALETMPPLWLNDTCEKGEILKVAHHILNKMVRLYTNIEINIR